MLRLMVRRFAPGSISVPVAGLSVLLLAGCSSDMMRFDNASFASNGSPQTTGSIVPPAPIGGAQPVMNAGAYPTQTVASAPIQPPVQQLASHGTGQGTLGTIQGRTVTVRPGDTIYSIASSNGTDAPTLMRMNGLNDPTAIRVGQTLQVPVGAQPVTPAPVQVAAAPSAVGNAVASTTQQATTVAPGQRYTVTSGDTVYSIARRHGISRDALIAHNNLQSADQIRVGQTLAIPNAQQAAAATSPARPVQAPAPAPIQTQTGTVQTGAVQTVSVQSTPETPTVTAETVETANTGAQDTRVATRTNDMPAPAAMSATTFRWPARGRILSSFGEKSNGQVNDGINIAVPEGTSIRASENGTVIYAGNELQGFGNLVLVRHEGDWVTAYAHNSELMVRRGDTVQRGQIIARAGSTGNVTTPQLHFEVRQGSKPVDPLKHLSAL